MRFLNKLTFINSATIKYAEVSIDGNVHLIGTQGVGKSTLLRSILFFYNADTLKLGISREKKSFAEYYFPYQNSYLVYEVATETGYYSILAFKSQGKVCFRFIDTAYNKKYFIAEDGKAFENWDATRSLLDANKIFYTKKIDRYEEYRDILYGNNETKKDFKRYAILESKQYQNIPRTIQNVFLNSKLDAEFIKQTIIMSLNEEDIKIDLQSYTHHLKDFEVQLKDISLIREPIVIKQSENVIKLHTAIRHLDREKIQFALQLAYSYQQIQKLEPKLFDKKEREDSRKQAQLQKIDESEKRFHNKIQKIRGEITLLDDKLKTIKEKKEYYEQKNIAEIEIRVAKKQDVEAELLKQQKEKELLTVQFKEVTQKYDLILQNIESSFKTFEQNKNVQRLELKEHLLTFKSELNEQFDKLYSDIKQNSKQGFEQAQQDIEQKQQQLHELNIKKEALKHKRFYEEEVQEIKQELNNLQLAIQQSSNEIQNLKSKAETWQKQFDLESDSITQNTKRAIEKHNDSIATFNNQITAIENKLKNSKDSFYGWLNEYNKGWENNIGKLIDEEVLFQNDLSPQKNDASNSLYGVQLNLNELQSKVKTLEDYSEEKSKLLEAIEDAKKTIAQLTLAETEDIEKLRRKYLPKIKECKDSIAEHNYTVEQNTLKIDNAKLNLKDFELKANTEKQNALQEIEASIDAATEKLLAAKQYMQSIEESLQKQLKSKEKEYDKKLTIEEETINTQLRFIEEDINKYKRNYELEKEKPFKQQQHELAGQGANTQQLATVENQLKELQKELSFIEKNRDLVTEYKKDNENCSTKLIALKTKSNS